MVHLDRLSSLISHFEIRVSTDLNTEDFNLVIYGNHDGPESLWLAFSGDAQPNENKNVLAEARIDFGGKANPILDALPSSTFIPLDGSPELKALANLICLEFGTRRCGGQIALDRLCEFLLVSVLRKQIETAQSDTGLLAGLANPHLSPVLVAIHDKPGRPWKLDDLVELSAQSRSQFMDTFQLTLGKSPMSYLKQWRMTLARNALLGGARVKETARRFGYGSGDAFTRAFTATYGVAPTKINQDTSRP